MKLKDLLRLKDESRLFKVFRLNARYDFTYYETRVIEYAKKYRHWMYYYLDERGGINYLRTFVREEDVCAYALDGLIKSMESYRDSDIDAVKRDATDHMDMKELNRLINFIIPKGYYSLNDPTGINAYALTYNEKLSVWEYYFTDGSGGKHSLKTFNTESEACTYVLDDAITVIRTLTDAEIDAVRLEYNVSADRDYEDQRLLEQHAPY